MQTKRKIWFMTKEWITWIVFSLALLLSGTFIWVFAAKTSGSVVTSKEWNRLVSIATWGKNNLNLAANYYCSVTYWDCSNNINSIHIWWRRDTPCFSDYRTWWITTKWIHYSVTYDKLCFPYIKCLASSSNWSCQLVSPDFRRH